jgi:ribosomal protein S12 methylthiotransferase accessory factor
MITARAIKPGATEPSADPLVCDPLTGIVQNCSEVVLEPDDPRVFAFFAEATHTTRFGTGEAPCNRFGCAVGLTREWAVGATVGETVERYCGALYDTTALRRASYNELDEEAVAPEEFALFSERQYAELAAKPPAKHRYQPFTRETRTGWVHGFNLTTRRPILVPAPFVYLPYRYRKDEPFIVDSISSGTACARSRDEATLKGLYEAVERDADAIVWFNALSCPRVELDGDDEIGRLFRERFKVPGLRYEVVDITMDIPIPSVAGFIIDERGGTVISSATRLEPYAAVEKTLLEAAQGKISWKREIITGPPERFAPDFHDVVDFPHHSKVYMLREMRRHIEFMWGSERTISVADIPNRSTGNVAEDLELCVELLSRCGLRAIAVDITSEDAREAGYWVVRVVIPGLHYINARHGFPQFGGRRLYEAPYQRGYVPRPKTEDEMNLFLHPFP